MNKQPHRTTLQTIARRAMIERGLLPDFPESVMSEVNRIASPASYNLASAKDLRHLLWCSVDNAESRDLDQLSYAEKLADGAVRLMVAIADVDELVHQQTMTDQHAQQNAASIYTVAQIFPMLPERLSTDLTSLRLDADRCAVVVEMVVEAKGSVKSSDIYCAMVRNCAKLDYDSLAVWLAGDAPTPSAVLQIEGLADNIKLQDHVAQQMKSLRFENGALNFETIESRPVFDGNHLREIQAERNNRAKSLIENLMIATNVATSQFLNQKQFPAIRRVVKTPKRWERIVELATEDGFELSLVANPKALSNYLKHVKDTMPDQYVDKSLSVLKLLGAGEYVVEYPNSEPLGHFGLGVKSYSHSTAPNRRYPDLITHRLLKSAMVNQANPYSEDQLVAIARHCTRKEDDAKKVERMVEKAANAILLSSRIGEVFDAIVSGAASKGTWVRLFHPHVEGKLVKGFAGLEVGHKLKVRLIHVDVEAGFIDFEKVN